jgi:hypothetical protein
VGLVLFVSELGGGFGHVQRLLPIARAAASDGHSVIFLVPNPDEVKVLLAPAGFEARLAPIALSRPGATSTAPAVATSYGDILGAIGFGDVDYLSHAIARWEATLADLRPAAVVCEMSPFLNVATFRGEVPVLVVGHGFGLPPPEGSKFPPLWDGKPLFDQEQLLEVVRHVCRVRGRATPAALPAILEGTAHAVTGLAELDPYRSLRSSPALGPPGLDIRPRSSEPEYDVFAYLSGDAAITADVLRALALSGLRGRVFVRRPAQAHREALERGRLTWLERPEPIVRALAQAKVVVHHGGMLTSEEALTSGTPQVVAPVFLENLLTAKALRDLGVATVLRPRRPPSELLTSLGSAVADPDLASAASKFAEHLRRTSTPTGELGALLWQRIAEC